MKDIFARIHRRMCEGKSLVLVTIMEGVGSSPRDAGAAMLVEADHTVGTIGGGAVEFEAQRIAREALEKESDCIRKFDLSSSQSADLGMICGGSVTVYFQYIAPDERMKAFFEKALSLCEQDQASWMLTTISPQSDFLMAAFDARKQMVAGDYRGGEDRLERMLSRRFVLEKGEDLFFAQPLARTGRAFLFGGGHIAQQLAPVLCRVRFPCTIVDSHPDFANANLFPPDCNVCLAQFEGCFEKLTIREQDYIVIVTRGHQFDYEVLKQALATPAQYIGMIGSRQKVAATYERLISVDGFTQADVRRVCAPIGLDIGGRTPEEISISIAAQMIQARSRHRSCDLVPLRE